MDSFFHEDQVSAKPGQLQLQLQIAAWEDGAKTTYPDQPKIRDHSVFFVDRDVVVPPLYGARSLTLLFGVGVRIFGLEQRSHNSVYFMDGFRKLD